MTGNRVALLMSGSFNPVTNMHLRGMELARDSLQEFGYDVVLGLISPVSDGYKKDSLIGANHRTEMLSLAISSSNWIKLSTWESDQSSWTRTAVVLSHLQDCINCSLNDNYSNTIGINGNLDEGIVLKMLCGADNLAGFLQPGLWSIEDKTKILRDHGMVVITRAGYDIDQIIYEDDILYRHRKNIHIVKEHIDNTVSSTKIRRACLRGQSIKYLVPEKVEEYIRKHNLYGSLDYKFNTVSRTTTSFEKIVKDSLNTMTSSSARDKKMRSKTSNGSRKSIRKENASSRKKKRVKQL